MTVSYRTRRRFRRLLLALLVLALVAAVVWLCWVIWLERYVIYSDSGATLNFDRPLDDSAAQVAAPPAEQEPISIYFNEGDQVVDVDNELKQLSGCWADTNTILDGIGPIRAVLEELAPGSAVLLDVKSKFGNFYYSTALGETSSSVDIAAMDALIAWLAKSDLYLIARVPAFRDRNFGIKNTGSCLPSRNGYLWEDSDKCYWMDPANSGSIGYLVSIASELRSLGFDEVVFSEFRIPDAQEIVYSGDRATVIQTAASTLETSCSTQDFAVSFQSDDPAFSLPEGRSRLYLEGVEPSAVTEAVAARSVETPEIRLVFLTQTNDTRYDDYGALHPVVTNLPQ